MKGMRTGKTLLAIALLLSAAREMASLWRETADVMSLVIALGITALMVGALLWSAFKRSDPLKPPNPNWRIFWIVMGCLGGLSIAGSLIQGVLPRIPKHTIEVQGLRIPLDDCIDGNVRVSKNLAERKEFCTCMATLVASYNGLSAEHLRRVARGDFFTVIEELKTDTAFDMSQLSACMAGMHSSQWTETMLNGARKECLRQCTLQGLDESYDTNKFCDCWMEKIRPFAPAQVAAWQTDTTSMVGDMQQACLDLSLR